MRTVWLSEKVEYDGSQLEPLKNYLKYRVLGDSVVAWRGPCRVDLEHMIDGEDLIADAKIESDDMLHFVLELFGYPLAAAIGLQRLMSEIMVKQIGKLGDSEKASELERQGDDLYWAEKKLNVSIATCSATSSLIHFGVNVGNEGTPVPTCSLQDFAIKDVENFAREFMDQLKDEFLSQKRAAVKVRSF